MFTKLLQVILTIFIKTNKVCRQLGNVNIQLFIIII